MDPPTTVGCGGGFWRPPGQWIQPQPADRWRQELEADLVRLRGEVAWLNNSVAGARAEAGRLNGELQAAKDENNRIKGEFNAAKAELDKLKANLQDSQKDVAGLKDQLQRSQDKLKRLKDMLAEPDNESSVNIKGKGHADMGFAQHGQVIMEEGELNIG